MAKLNTAYLSSLNKRAKLLSSYLPVSPSRVFSAISGTQCTQDSGTPDHLGYSVPPALHRTIWCRSTFGLRGSGLSNPTSFLRPCSPDGTDKRRQHQRQTERPPPEPSNILKSLCALFDDKIRYYKKKVSKSCSLFNWLALRVDCDIVFVFAWKFYLPTPV